MGDSNNNKNFVGLGCSFKDVDSLDEQLNSSQEYGLKFGLYAAKLTGWMRYMRNNIGYMDFAFQITDEKGNGKYLSYRFKHNTDCIKIDDDFDKLVTALYLGRPNKRAIKFDSLIGMKCSLLINVENNQNYIDLVGLPF